MIPLPYPVGRQRRFSERELRAGRRRQRRQRARWVRAWCKAGMPGYYEDWESKRWYEQLLRSER